MTRPSEHGQEPIDRWLASRHHELRDGLSRFLDPDAGLREAMLHGGHGDLLDTLGSTLDAEAGLAAILPAPTAAAPQPLPDPPRGESGLPAVAAAIAAADPAVRLALRHSPVILAVILSDLTVRALVIANEALTPRARDRARDLGRDLARARDLALDLDLDLALARDLALDLDLALNSAIALDLALAPGRALTSDLALARHLARDLARARDLALTSARDLALAPGRDLARNLARTSDLARDLALTSDLAHQTAIVVGRALGVQQVEGLASALLEGALDDFTRADLAHADLTGRDLTGVRWSDWGTRWPTGTDVDVLRARSRKVAPGTGIYVITSPGDGNKARYTAPV